MKKLILFVALVCSFATVKAQDYAGRISGPVSFAHGAVRHDTTSVTIPGGRSAITFKYDITKTSGTIAGTIVLQTHLSTISGEQWVTLDTYNLTNATATNVVRFVNNPGLYYRIITTTTDTSGVSVHNKYLLYRR